MWNETHQQKWVISIIIYMIWISTSTGESSYNLKHFKTESFGLIVFSRQYNKVTSNQYLHTTLIISEASICRKSVSLKCLSAVKKTATSAHYRNKRLIHHDAKWSITEAISLPETNFPSRYRPITCRFIKK